MLNLLTIAIALLSLQLPAEGEPTVATIAPPVGLVVIDDLAVFIHADLRTTTVPIEDVRLAVSESGSPDFVLVGDATNGSTVQTTYESVQGVHLIITPCKGMSAVRCAQKHKDQVDAMQSVFPKKT